MVARCCCVRKDEQSCAEYYFYCLSYHYYFVRSRVKAKKTNSTVEDDGEALSGIKYGPLWYPNPPNQTSHKKGYVFLTKKCPPCTLGNISYNNLEAFSLHLFSTILINPEPKKLIQFGFVYIKGTLFHN